MNQTKQLNNRKPQKATDKVGTSLAKVFFAGKQSNLTASQVSELNEYVHKMATGHAYNRYYLGSLNEPPQTDYIDDLTQTALLALFDGKTTRYKKLTRGAVAAVTTLLDCKTTVDKVTKKVKPLTDVQAFRRFIAVTFNDYNYNERATTATVGKRKNIPLELTADSTADELFYITDMSDFARWTEKELNDLHAMHLTQNELNIINIVFSEKLTKKELAFLTYHINHPCNNRRQNAYAFNKQLREKSEKELNTFDLIEKKLKPALKKELKKQGITSGLLVYLLFD